MCILKFWEHRSENQDKTYKLELSKRNVKQNTETCQIA